MRWVRGAGIEEGFELPQLPFLNWTWEALAHHGPSTVVVCEDYTINAATVKKSPAPWSLEIIGTLKWQAYKHGAVYVGQDVSDAKNFVTNDRLREAGCWTRGHEHARDAGRHLLLYMARIGWYDGSALKKQVTDGS